MNVGGNSEGLEAIVFFFSYLAIYCCLSLSLFFFSTLRLKFTIVTLGTINCCRILPRVGGLSLVEGDFEESICIGSFF